MGILAYETFPRHPREPLACCSLFKNDGLPICGGCPQQVVFHMQENAIFSRYLTALY